MIMPLLKPLPLDKWGKARQFMLMASWEYNGWTVPKGFVTDGASVPRALYWLFEPTGVLFLPAILHDYLYKVQITTRAEADKLFRINVIKESNVIAGWLAWAGVRLLGWLPWRIKRRKV